jgi:hypothetical protein
MLAIDVGEFAIPAFFLLIIGVGLYAVSYLVPHDYGIRIRFGRGRRPAAPSVSAEIVVEPETTGPVIPTVRTITWPSMIDPDVAVFAPDERRRLLEGFGIVGDDWSASVLARAFDEEDDELRLVAIESLAVCEGPLVLPILERAYASYAVPERYAAIDGASRRGDVALLERGLRDTDGTVALAAAFGLQRARRDDLVERALTDRDDARANEIRRVLPMLG